MINKRFNFFLFPLIGAFTLSVIFGLAPLGGAAAISAQAATSLAGRILLQVQDKGQAWYVNPLNSQRYYLGRPDDAYALMRSLGLGVSNSDLTAFQKAVPYRLVGRILLQVQDKGQAYYVNPVDLKLYYLGRPTDAFNLMRSQGLGITNSDLAKIPIASVSSSGSANSGTLISSIATAPASFTFKYQNNTYELTANLNATLYNAYKNSPKVYTYQGDMEPAGARNDFYGMFLKLRSGDNSIVDLAAKMQAIAANNNWTGDQLVEFALAFVQYISYDRAKITVESDRNINPYYPYETLYLDRGVCSDKTFLAVALLRKLGYGAAILDFPDLNHTAVGIACPSADSVNSSGYCYAETTNYFPLGVIPKSINAGQAQTSDNQFTGLFDSSGLGKIEIYQKTSGKIYSGVAATEAKVRELADSKDELDSLKADISSRETSLRSQESELSDLKTQMDGYYNSGRISQYNNLVPAYNTKVNQYNAALADYRTKTSSYNQKAASFNAALNIFYQK